MGCHGRTHTWPEFLRGPSLLVFLLLSCRSQLTLQQVQSPVGSRFSSSSRSRPSSRYVSAHSVCPKRCCVLERVSLFPDSSTVPCACPHFSPTLSSSFPRFSCVQAYAQGKSPSQSKIARNGRWFFLLAFSPNNRSVYRILILGQRDCRSSKGNDGLACSQIPPTPHPFKSPLSMYDRLSISRNDS